MSRRNPTKRQRRIVNDLMKNKKMSYEEACMTLPESKPDLRCLHEGNPDPTLTNLPKIKKNGKQKPYTTASSQTGIVWSLKEEKR